MRAGEAQLPINVKGVVFTVQKALPLVPDGGAVILTGSIVGIKGFPAFSIYSTTKAAVCNLARTWTTDLKDRSIRVNVVSPGPIDTPLFNRSFADPDDMKRPASKIVMGRLGRPEEIAKAVVFLRPMTPVSSPARSYSSTVGPRRSDPERTSLASMKSPDER